MENYLSEIRFTTIPPYHRAIKKIISKNTDLHIKLKR